MTAFPPRYRRNFIAFMSDYVGFAVAMTFASSMTVLPDFVSRLTDSEVAVGLVTTVSNGAWLLPQLVFANLLANKRHKKRYLILGASIGRPFYLLYAAALMLGLHRYPLAALLLLYGTQFIFFGTDALASVAWFDMLGKAIPEKRRGRLVGFAQFFSGVLSIGGGILIAALLGGSGPSFPYNYAAILALAGMFLFVSLIAICFIVEPDEPVEEERPIWRDYLPRLVDTLRQDEAFRRLILVRLLTGADALALSFYILFATQKLGLPDATVGHFTSVQIAGRLLASVGLGTLAERAGAHRVVQVSTGIGLTAPLVGLLLFLTDAWASPVTIVIFGWVYVTIGITISAGMLGFYNYLLDMAPTGQRPTYIGLFNSISGALIVLPALGGWLLEVTSFGVLFALTAGFIVVGHFLSLRLPSARMIRTTVPVEAPGEQPAC